MDVFFYETFAEEEEALRQCLKGSPLKAGFTPCTIQEYGNDSPPASLISIRTQSEIPLLWKDLLTGILSRSTGYDHLESYLQQSGVTIPCGYLPLYCNRAVAEQAMLLWMALMRRLPQQIGNMQTFHRDGLTGVECEHKVLLVVGVGNVGYEVVRIGRGLGMEVLGVDIVERYPDVKYVSIDQILPRADVIVCAMNLTSENSGYFSYELLKKAKREFIFVNVARGELSLATELSRLLDEGCLGGVALDVFDHESELAVFLRTGQEINSVEVLATMKIARHPRAILTPHNAFNTREAVARKAAHSLKQIEYFRLNHQFLWPIPIDIK